MFQFGRFPAYAYFIQRTLRDSSSRWFPNSDICGSGLICSSPQLFAACHILRRLPMPRHSLCALFSLNFSDNISRYCPRFLVIDSFELVTFFRLAIFVVSFTNLNGKTFISVLFTNPVWFFSIICSFAYSVFNEHLIPRVYSRELVGLDGLEPSTSRLSGARSNHLSYRPVLSGIALRVFGSYSSSPTGGDDGIRTHDPLLAGQVLSQLSYTPVVFPFARSLEIEQQAKSDASVLAYLSRILLLFLKFRNAASRSVSTFSIERR